MSDPRKERVLELLLNDEQFLGVQYFIPTFIADKQYVGVYGRRQATHALADKLAEMFKDEHTPVGYQAVEGQSRISMRAEVYVMSVAQRRELYALFIELIQEIKQLREKEEGATTNGT